MPTIADSATSPWTLLYVLPKFVQSGHVPDHVQAAAEAALVLDGYRSDPDSRFGLTVRISDPSVKAKRSDEKDAVLFVGGLNAKTTEQDVRDLFKDVSHELKVITDWSQKISIKSLKLGWDSVKAICKGFAFVTLNSDVSELRWSQNETDEQADAKEGLKLHGTW
jgi:hypothetical protein